jgi:hypothetical protein
VAAVVKVIGRIATATLAIATADNHRGCGNSGSLILANRPVNGTLYFDSWDELEGPGTRYTIQVKESNLFLYFEAPIGSRSKVVAIFKGPMPNPNARAFTDGPLDFVWWYFSDNRRDVWFSIFSREVISADTGITVYTTEVVKHDLDAIHIIRDGTHFDTNFDGVNPMNVSTTGLLNERYNLVVGELVKGRPGKYKRLNDFYYVVEFTVGDPEKTKAVNFDQLHIAHVVNIRPDSTTEPTAEQQSRVIQRVKAIDRDGGGPVSLAFDKEGKSINVEKVLADAKARHFEDGRVEG